MILQIYISLIFGFALFIQSVFGFGGGFISILILSLIIPMKFALGMGPLVVNATCIIAVLTNLKAVSYKSTLKIFIKALPGLLIAGFLLKMIQGELMVFVASGLIFFYCLYSLSGKVLHFPERLEFPLSSLAGFIGVISGVWTVFVPIMNNREEEPDRFRTTLLSLWVCFSMVLIPIYVSNEFITRSVVISALWTLPVVLIASWLGKLAVKRIKPEMFRSLLLMFLLAISVMRIIMLLIELLAK